MGESAPVVEFSSPEEKETVNIEGVVTLAWKSGEADEETVFELQQSEDAGFENPIVRYTGIDRGSVLTGFAAGDYHFRVRALEPKGDWSEPVVVKIEYMKKIWVVFLLAVGLAVFIGTVSTLLVCHFRKPAS